MKKTIIIIAIAIAAAIAAYLIFFNDKEEQQIEPEYEDSEIIEAEKICYAQSALDSIDTIVNNYMATTKAYKSPIDVVLTEKEKLAKPDYLLNPSAINTVVTRNQKIRALAMLVGDRTILLAYGMPTTETDAAIATLALDLSFPLEVETLLNPNIPLSENVKTLYNYCRENNEIEAFWEYFGAAINEVDYIIACDPDLYLSKVSEQEWDAYNYVWECYADAATTLAPYDKEMSLLNTIIYRDAVFQGDESCDNLYRTIDMAKQGYRKTHDRVVVRRNNMLTN